MELERHVESYSLADDPLPLHPDFYRFIQKDERGYFIADKGGNRWEITFAEPKDGI
jgi:hypothetical protein